MKMRDREQLARECVEIEKRGGCVRDYLRGLGCVSPWGTWHRLQKEELGRSDAQITDGKGKGMKQPKITDEQKNEAARIAIEGGDPREYLKECGREVAYGGARAFDLFTNEEISPGFSLMTDGVFGWRSDLIYHIEHYNSHNRRELCNQDCNEPTVLLLFQAQPGTFRSTHCPFRSVTALYCCYLTLLALL